MVDWNWDRKNGEPNLSDNNNKVLTKFLGSILRILFSYGLQGARTQKFMFQSALTGKNMQVKSNLKVFLQLWKCEISLSYFKDARDMNYSIKSF